LDLVAKVQQKATLEMNLRQDETKMYIEEVH